MATTTTAPSTTPGLDPEDDPRVRWRPDAQGAVARVAVLAVLLLIGIAAPLLVPDTDVNLVTNTFVFGIIALSMNVLLGYVGSVSLGHQAFVGIGAFTSGFVLTDMGLPWPIAVLVAIIIGALQAGVIGIVALRVQGFFFAIVTLAYGLFAKDVLFNITALTGGGAGQEAPRPGFTVPADDYTGSINGDVRYAWLVLAILILVWVLDWRLTSTRGGRAIQALRDDPRVAASWGINVNGFTLLAFMLSGAIAGLAGALQASTFTFISVESYTLIAALTFVLMTTVGGVGSRPGVVIGGFIFSGLGPLLTAMNTTTGWGTAEEAFGDTPGVEVCSSTAARGTAFLIGALLVGAAVAAGLRLLSDLDSAGPGRVIGVGLASLLGLVAGVWIILGGTFGAIGGFCVFTVISDKLESVIGVILLLVVLIRFPGGIAQQLAKPIRWLSFGKWQADETETVGGGTAAGSSSMRP